MMGTEAKEAGAPRCAWYAACLVAGLLAVMSVCFAVPVAEAAQEGSQDVEMPLRIVVESSPSGGPAPVPEAADRPTGVPRGDDDTAHLAKVGDQPLAAVMVLSVLAGASALAALAHRGCRGPVRPRGRGIVHPWHGRRL